MCGFLVYVLLGAWAGDLAGFGCRAHYAAADAAVAAAG